MNAPLTDPKPLPTNAPTPQEPGKTVVQLRLTDPFRWLASGARDLGAHPGVGLFYGLAFWLMAVILGAVFRSSPEYTMTVASGCLLLGPFMAMGLYDVSRRRERGEVPALGASLTCWDSHLGSMGMLVLVLIVLELLWGRASLVVFAVFFNTGMPSTTGVIQAVFNPENWEFLLAYTLVGGAFAVVVFSISVVSMPTILDRDADAITAAITSLQVVFNNVAVMVLWGLLIVAMVAGALMLPWGGGLVLVGPWLGHASWHAYRGAVRWSSAP